MAVKLSFEERKWLLKCYWKMENAEVQRRWWVEYGTPPPPPPTPPPPPPWVTIIRIRDKIEVDGLVKIFWKVGAEEREVPLITRVLMLSCRFLHDPKRSHWGNVIVSLISRNPVFIEFCESKNYIPLATIQTVFRSVWRRSCECRPTVAEDGHFEHVRTLGSLKNTTQYKLYFCHC